MPRQRLRYDQRKIHRIQVMLRPEIYIDLLKVTGAKDVSTYVADLLEDHLYGDNPPSKIQPTLLGTKCRSCGEGHRSDMLAIGDRVVMRSGQLGTLLGWELKARQLVAVVDLDDVAGVTMTIDPCQLRREAQ